MNVDTYRHLSAISNVEAQEDILKITEEKKTEYHRRATQIHGTLMSYNICQKNMETCFQSASRKICQPGILYAAHCSKYKYKI